MPKLDDMAKEVGKLLGIGGGTPGAAPSGGGDVVAALSTSGGDGPAPGAGGAAIAMDPLIGPTGPPIEHHAGMLLQSGYRQYDQVLLNAGYQPPPPPPSSGAVAVPAAQSYMRDVAVGVAAESAQMGAAAVAGRVSLGLVARALAQSAPALAGAPLYAGALSRDDCRCSNNRQCGAQCAEQKQTPSPRCGRSSAARRVGRL